MEVTFTRLPAGRSRRVVHTIGFLVQRVTELLHARLVTFHTSQPPPPTLQPFIPWTLVKRGVKQEVITPIDAPEDFRAEVMASRRAEEDAQDTASVRALDLAHYWQHLLDTGRFQSLTEIAAAEGMDLAQVSRIARLAWVGAGVKPTIEMEPRVRRGRSAAAV